MTNKNELESKRALSFFKERLNYVAALGNKNTNVKKYLTY